MVDPYLIVLSVVTAFGIVPAISLPFVLMLVLFKKRAMPLLRTSFQTRLMLVVFVALLIQVGWRVTVATIPMTEVFWYIMNGLQLWSLFGLNIYLANSAKRRLLDVGLSKFWTLLMGIPIMNVGLSLFLAFTMRTSDSR